MKSNSIFLNNQPAEGIVSTTRECIVLKQKQISEIRTEISELETLIKADEFYPKRKLGYHNTVEAKVKELSNTVETLQYEIDILSKRCLFLKGPFCNESLNVDFVEETVEGAVDSETIVVNVKLPDGTAAKTCLEYYKLDPTLRNGEYFIKPFDDENEFKVFCLMQTERPGMGGYTVFQRRIDKEDFFLFWNNYVEGFGNPRTSYWLGLKRISKFSKLYPGILRVDLYHHTEKKNYYAEYSDFSVDPEMNNFTLQIGKFSGDLTLGDSLSRHNGMKFSTRDRDNDVWEGNCAQSYKGAFWYQACHDVNLNGAYLKGYHDSYADGIEWLTKTNHHYSLEKTAMSMKEQ